jgi:hypothetical protein
MGWRKGTLDDPERFGKLSFLASIPTKTNQWGLLGKLRETPWWDEMVEVPNDIYKDAINGWVAPLRKALGTPPRVRAKRLPVISAMCKEYQDKSCPSRTELCRPGTGKMPKCYTAPFEDSETCYVAYDVAEAWDEGRYVFSVRE